MVHLLTRKIVLRFYETPAPLKAGRDQIRSRNMAKITLKGEQTETIGYLPDVGDEAPDFTLTGKDLSETTLKDFAGKQIVLNIFPSIDTEVCATSVRRFNAEASKLDNSVVLCVSADLPFAHQRFCAAEGLDDVISLSSFRSEAFGKDYGVSITSGPLTGLLARAIVIINESGEVIFTEQVPEIVQEPNYEAALAALS
jgi:thiol peroxidase